MHGYGYPPQQPPTPRPSASTLSALRAIFVVLTVLSCGFLGWAAMLRLAIVTRRPRDWWLCAVAFVLTVGLFAYFAALPDEEEMTDAQALLGVGWMVALLVGVLTYYLIMEVRHYAAPDPYDPRRSNPGATAVPYGPATHQNQPPAHHQGPLPVQQHPTPPPHTTPTPTPNPYAVDTTPPKPAPQRLDQVRAELDELSDYLRKEGEGR
ncbi:hypothetical protein [Streptomyces sp. B27]|uniref:hypothetical protein n=1 Tax=Streptomyces TaxID=1883 RepID=UPI000FD7F599|nr:hypothetical protein [Streptomyces sp. B27]